MVKGDILIVEDNYIVMMELQHKLESFGYAVPAVASSGEQAIERAGEIRPDLVLMDIRLKGDMDGIQAAEQILARFDIPVIFLTAYADEDTVQRAKITGPFGYLLKPFDDRSLHSAIEIALYRHGMERTLKESEERYRVVSELISDLAYAFRVEPDGTLVREWVTGAFSAITGHSLKELSRPNDWASVVHIEDRPAFQHHVQTLLSGQSDVCELRIITKDDQVRWVRSYGHPVWDDALGRVVRFYGGVQDFTGRKQTEEESHRRAAQLEALRQIGLELTAQLDLDTLLQSIASRAVELLGGISGGLYLYRPQQNVLEWSVAVGPNLPPPPGAILKQGEGLSGKAWKTDEVMVVDDYQHWEGRTAIYEGYPLTAIVAAPIRWGDQFLGVLNVLGEPPRTFSPADAELLDLFATQAAAAIENARLHRALRDHAEQLEHSVQERTAQLAAERARLEAILYSTVDGIVVTSADGTILQANPIAQAWLTQTLSPQEASHLLEAVRRVAMRAHEQPVELLELTGLDLELSGALISQPVIEDLPQPDIGEGDQSLPSGRQAVVAIHDVSHLKALDRMRTHFVTNVSHALRTPVTTIKLYAYLMQRQPEKWMEYLAPLAREADHQARLVEDILQISRIDAGRIEMDPRPTALNELIGAVVDNRQAQAAQQGLTLVHHPAKSGPTVLVDSQRIQQALDNLVDNGIRYTPEGGSIALSTGTAEVEGRTWATATVTDTGMGIPADELPHIFERFFRGEKPRTMQLAGPGLGLSVAKEIVELHGGRVTVESEEGVGTTFTILLPLTSDDQHH
jgi:PAS domain S-box-containing protein